MPLSRPCLCLSSLLATVLLSACASKDPERVASAATAPLSDLNLMQVEIPPVLLAASKQPYRVPPEAGRMPLQAEIQELDAALGPDLDAPAGEDPDLLERGGEEAKKAAISALRRTTEGVLPFRSWVRKLTGAERHSRRVSSAIAAGTARRAFLKGLRVNLGCQPAGDPTPGATPGLAAPAAAPASAPASGPATEPAR